MAEIVGHVECKRCGTKHAVRSDSQASGPWCCYHRIAPHLYCRTQNYHDFQAMIRKRTDIEGGE